MQFSQSLRSSEAVHVRAGFWEAVHEALRVGRAKLRIEHKRPTNYLRDPATGLFTIPDPRSYVYVEPPEEVFNVKTNVGIVQLHTQGYGTSGLLTCGFNFIALSNDPLTETSASTTLSTEIAANGLTRAQGTVTLPTGSGTVTTISRTFTATGAQAAQKAALFTAVSVGVMNHALAFTQKTLAINDTLTPTFSVTLS